MRRIISIVVVVGLLSAVFLWWQRGEQVDPASSEASLSEGSTLATAMPIRATSPTVARAALQTPAPDRAVEARRVVHFSSRDRRSDESDLQFQNRIDWLDGFLDFEKRANLTPMQREQLISVLADAQQHAVLGWNERNAAIRDPRRAYGDFEGVPKLASMNKSMRLELLPKLREFLTHEQMVSFRRSRGLTDPFGTARTQPLEIAFESDEVSGDPVD